MNSTVVRAKTLKKERGRRIKHICRGGISTHARAGSGTNKDINEYVYLDISYLSDAKLCVSVCSTGQRRKTKHTNIISIFICILIDDATLRSVKIASKYPEKNIPISKRNNRLAVTDPSMVKMKATMKSATKQDWEMTAQQLGLTIIERMS
jgi:hypothetical protein